MTKKLESEYGFPLSSVATLGHEFSQFATMAGYTFRTGLETFLYLPYVIKNWRGTFRQLFICSFAAVVKQPNFKSCLPCSVSTSYR